MYHLSLYTTEEKRDFRNFSVLFFSVSFRYFFQMVVLYSQVKLTNHSLRRTSSLVCNTEFILQGPFQKKEWRNKTKTFVYWLIIMITFKQLKQIFEQQYFTVRPIDVIIQQHKWIITSYLQSYYTSNKVKLFELQGLGY